jgi:hypothetical protein
MEAAGSLPVAATRTGPPSPGGPVRASTAAGRAQEAEPDRRAGEDTTQANHARAGAAGALIPLEDNSATRGDARDRLSHLV